MSFGFSAGDFLAAITLVGTVVNALRECGGSKSEYRELIQELYSLETALLRVKQLELEEHQRSEYLSLRYAAAQCQRTIDDFMRSVMKYQKHLRQDGSSSQLLDCWMKVKWNFCKKDDLANFKTSITAHVQSIQILLTALQMNAISLSDRHRATEHKSLMGTIQNLTMTYLKSMDGVKSSIIDGVEIGRKLLDNTAGILRTSIQIFQTVNTILNIVTRIPNQVDRQQPVFMVDAIGRTTPFHLEFIQSSEAFSAVLEANFSKIPSGKRKIRDNEFVVQDLDTGRLIRYSEDWSQSFVPGQRVEMRMIFHRGAVKRQSCPACRTVYVGSETTDIECSSCGLIFTRIVEIRDPSPVPKKAEKQSLRHYASVASYDDDSILVSAERPILPVTAYDEKEHITYYRRVNIVEKKTARVWEENVSEEDPPSYDRIDSTPNPEDAAVLPPTTADMLGQIPDWDSDDDLDGSIDPYSMKDFTDMDEDDDLEREFSRSIILGALETLDKTITKLGVWIDDENLGHINSYAHFAKGTCYTSGWRSLGWKFEQIQHLTGPVWNRNDIKPGLTDENILPEVKERFVTLRPELTKIEKRMKEYYRVTD